MEAHFAGGSVGGCRRVGSVPADDVDRLDRPRLEESTDMLSSISAVKKGTARYDPNAAATCIGSLPTDCTINQGWSSQGDGIFAAFDVFAAVPACNEVFTGLLSPGAVCGSDLECPSGTPTCTPIFLDRSQTCLPSQCESGRNPQPHAAGEDCSDNGLCQLPSVCDGTCIVPPGEGNPATPPRPSPADAWTTIASKQTMGRPRVEPASNDWRPGPPARLRPRRSRTPASPMPGA